MTDYLPALTGAVAGSVVASLAGLFGGPLALELGLGVVTGNGAVAAVVAAAVVARVAVPVGCWMALRVGRRAAAGPTALLLLVLAPLMGPFTDAGNAGQAAAVALLGAGLSRFLVLAVFDQPGPVRPGGEGVGSP